MIETIKNSKQRNSNIELLRITCMLMIVIGHVMMWSDILGNVGEKNYYIGNLLRSFTVVAVNSFVLISGYFGIKLDVRKLLKIILMVLFYSVVFLVLGIISGRYTIQIKRDIGFLIPILSKKYWYITIYIVLCLVSPWLNSFIESITKESLKKLLIVLWALFCIWPTLAYTINVQTITNDAGYGLINFVFLYLLGRYIKLYYDKEKLPARIYFLGYIASAVLMFGANAILTKIFGFYFNSYISYDTLFCFVGSLCLFLGFEHLKIQSKIVNKLAKNTLAIYVIHMHTVVAAFMSDYTNSVKRNGIGWAMWVLIWGVLIFVVCWLIEEIRKVCFSRLEDEIIKAVEKTRVYNIVKKVLEL